MIPSPERTTWLSQEILPHEPVLRAWLGRRQVVGLLRRAVALNPSDVGARNNLGALLQTLGRFDSLGRQSRQGKPAQISKRAAAGREG